MQQNLFDEPLYDYCFLIRPDLRTVEAVKELKQQLHDRIVLSWANLSSKPQLTLVEFQATESAEGEIVRRTIGILKDQPAFPVGLSGVLVLEHGKSTTSVVLKVKDPKPILEAQSLLRKALQLKREKSIPYVSIARNIPSAKLGSLEDFDYQGEFQCDRILLLKKPVAAKASYTVLCEALLQ